MSTRREAREWAVQLLFQLDLNPDNELEKVFGRFWEERSGEEKAKRFAEKIVKGVWSDIKTIDALLAQCAKNWDVRRMGVLDRNVIRMAVYEMMNCHDIPPAVSINEAVDLAKYFSSNESGKFVNGVLDRVRKELKIDSKSKPAGK